jgi:hypothetical protein
MTEAASVPSMKREFVIFVENPMMSSQVDKFYPFL